MRCQTSEEISVRMKVTIENMKNREQTHVLQFIADNEGDIGRYIKAAGDNFRMDYPNVPFDDKIIRLESAFLKTSKSENGDVSSGSKPA